jgi:hypothetical protein
MTKQSILRSLIEAIKSFVALILVDYLMHFIRTICCDIMQISAVNMFRSLRVRILSWSWHLLRGNYCKEDLG